MNHTFKTFEGMPTPWTVGICYNPHQAIAVFSSAPSEEQGTPLVCLVTPLDEVMERDKANAALIAAAPDLLEALQILLWDFESVIKDSSGQPSVIIAKHAIRKALTIESEVGNG
jgi:hypothetical protein